MEKIDLSLVPIDDLFNEIDMRSDFYVAAYQLINASGPTKIIHTNYKNDAWFGNLALCAALQSDILQESYNKKDEN